MRTATVGVTKRLVRVLLAAGILATGWLAVDLIVHADSAAAAETVDHPDVVGIVASAVDAVTAPVPPIVTAVDSPLQPVTAAATAPVALVVERISAPVIEPFVPAIDGIVTPVDQIVLEPLAPSIGVLTDPLLTTTDTVLAVLPPLPLLAMTPNSGILVGGGGLLLSPALGSPLRASAPMNGAPNRTPPTPALPSGSSTGAAGFFGELTSGVPTFRGGFESAAVPLGELPSPPSFAFDSTPD